MEFLSYQFHAENSLTRSFAQFSCKNKVSIVMFLGPVFPSLDSLSFWVY